MFAWFRAALERLQDPTDSHFARCFAIMDLASQVPAWTTQLSASKRLRNMNSYAVIAGFSLHSPF